MRPACECKGGLLELAHALATVAVVALVAFSAAGLAFFALGPAVGLVGGALACFATAIVLGRARRRRDDERYVAFATFDASRTTGRSGAGSR